MTYRRLLASQMSLCLGAFLGSALLASAQTQPPAGAPGSTQNATAIVKRFSDTCKASASYWFEGEFVISAKQGSQEGRLLAKSKVKFAVGEQGKSFLRVRPEEKDEYLLVSNGQKSWEFVARLKQYSEQDGAAVDAGSGDEDGEDGSAGGSDEEKDLSQQFALDLIGILRSAYETAQAADVQAPVEVKFNGKKERWPLYRVMSKKTPRDGLTLTQLALDPETQRLGRLIWANARGEGDQKTVVQLQVDFSSFELGRADPTLFEFEPPKNAKRVDAVPIPGQTGSFLLNKPAPDFELKTLDGDRIKLSELRGKPVLLNFWASWCGPCRREMPAMSKLTTDFQPQGLIVLGVNDEGRGEAKDFAKKYQLPFATLDDSSRKAHRAYRVQAIPTTFLIAPDGKIVRFLRGSQDAAELRAALKAVGL